MSIRTPDPRSFRTPDPSQFEIAVIPDIVFSGGSENEIVERCQGMLVKTGSKENQ